MQNFFEEQDRARRQSGRLLIGFLVAVVAILLLLYAFAVGVAELWSPAGEQAFAEPGWWWDTEIFLFVLIAHSIIVGGGTLLKIAEMREGGGAVARMLGGREIASNTRDPNEQRLRNVVEEMAIASGTPVPAIFVLDNELGMNAFAAGYSLHDAAVAVTRGGLRGWTREELQGVVAHEFSHILNGDMRLNIRLIGLLNGLLGIAMLGAMLLRASRAIAMSNMSRASRNNPAAGAAVVVVLGVVIWLIGSVGVLAGRMLKAGISREREYLADASAVQFTRNPAGIAGALRKVGGYDTGSRIEHPLAEETSHLFFGHALSKGLFGGLLATHPPLKDRIRRIDPSFHGAFHPFELPPAPAPDPASEQRPWGGAHHVAAAGLASQGPQAAGARMARELVRKDAERAEEGVGPAVPETRPMESYAIPLQAAEADAQHFVHTIGAPAFQHLRYGGAVLRELPDDLRNASHETVGAIAIVWALLLDRDAERREAQMEVLQELTGANALLLAVADLGPVVTALAPHLRLPLLDLCLPALSRLGEERTRQFLQVADQLTSRGEAVSVFRFALRKILHVHLEQAALRNRGVRYQALGGVAPDIMVLLSVLARIGHEEESSAREAFEIGVKRVQGLPKERVSMLPPEACTFLRLDRALDRLASASPGIKRRVVDACAHAIMADGEVTIEEAELLRAIGEVLECPVPPFLPRAEPEAA